MKNSKPDDIISACFDDELSAEERRKAEELLAESTDAREELEETDQLSRLLKSLPQAAAPTDLAATVMNRIEGESVAARNTATVISPTTVGHRILNWKVAIGSLAAAILAMIILPRLPVADQNASIQIVETEKSELDQAAVAGSLHEESVAGKDFDSASDVGQPEMGVASNRSGYKSEGNGHRAKITAPAKRMPAESIGMEPEFADNEMWEPSHDPVALHDIDWTKVKVGDMKRVLARPGDKVAVIEVTVVDIQNAVNETQYFLTTNSIRGYDDVLVDQDESNGLAKNDSVPESMILYVEAPEEWLNNALQRMSENDVLSNNTVIAGRSIDPDKIDVVSPSDEVLADASKPQPPLARNKPARKTEVKSTRTANATRNYNKLNVAIQPVNRSRRSRSAYIQRPQMSQDEKQAPSKDEIASSKVKEANSANESNFVESRSKNGPLVAPLPVADDTFQMLLRTPSLAQLQESETDDQSDDIASTIDKIAPRNQRQGKQRRSNLWQKKKPSGKKKSTSKELLVSSRPESKSERIDKPITVAASNVRVLFVFRKPVPTSVPAGSETD